MEAFRAFIPPLDDPDTGSFADDVRSVRAPDRGRAQQLAAGRHPAVAGGGGGARPRGRAAVQGVRHAPAGPCFRGIFARAAQRGELRDGLDPDVAIDLLVGPIFTRRLVTRAPGDPQARQRRARPGAARPAGRLRPAGRQQAQAGRGASGRLPETKLRRPSSISGSEAVGRQRPVSMYRPASRLRP